MQEKPGTDRDFLSVDAGGRKKLHLDVFLRTLIQSCMGKAIDYGRLSGMGDRSFQQYERTVKDEFYKVIEYGTAILNENGLIDEKRDKK